MSTKILPTDLDGLNLILGGGIPAVARGGATDESAVLLIRGGAGVGKTPVATQIAGSLARLLGVDVGYACIELLPDELAAQHAGFLRNVPEQVVPFPITGRVPREGCRIFAGILPLEADRQQNRARGLRPALEKFREDISSHSGRPRVLVVDSLSAGYGLGPDTDRELVDEVCKYAAAEGLIVILLEETRGDEPSVWSFAVDLVLSLGLNEGDRSPAMPEPYERRLTVIKNRFGPSDPGPHAFTLATGEGVFVMPRPASYLRPTLKAGAWHPDPNRLRVYAPWIAELLPGWPGVQDSVVLVSGAPLRSAYRVAAQFGRPPNGSAGGSDLVVSFQHHGPGFFPNEEFNQPIHVQLADPYLSQNAILSRVLAAVRHSEAPIQRVFVGDVGSLDIFRDTDGILRAIAVLAHVLRDMRTPCLLIERWVAPTGHTSKPEFASFTDVLVQFHGQATAKVMRLDRPRSFFTVNIPKEE